MIVHVDSRSVVPVFQQLRSQIERLIASGQLRPGSKLPPIRELAALVETAGRHGTVVLDARNLAIDKSDLAAAAETLAVITRQLGLDPTAAHRALDAALERL